MKSQRFKFTPLDNRKLPALRNRKKSHGATGRNLTVLAIRRLPPRPAERARRDQPRAYFPVVKVVWTKEMFASLVIVPTKDAVEPRRRPAIFMSNAPYLTPMTWPATSSTEFQKILIPSRERVGPPRRD